MAKTAVTSPGPRPQALSIGHSRRRWRNPRGIISLAAVFAVALAACGGTADGMAADFDITMYTGASHVGGDDVRLSDLRGNPVVLNFWAGLCGPCRAEMPEFQDFHNERANSITVIGVDVGRFTDLGSQEDATDLLESLSIRYPTGYTADSGVMQDYGVLVMPTTFFIDSRGGIFRKWAGPLDRKTLEEVTSEMLAQEPGSGATPYLIKGAKRK